MKIGSGGLQGLATHDDVAARQNQDRQLRKPDGTEEQQRKEGVTLVDEKALNKAVQKLNENARSNNLPVDFAVKKDDEKPYIEMKNTNNQESRNLQPEDFNRILQSMELNTGLVIDEYF